MKNLWIFFVLSAFALGLTGCASTSGGGGPSVFSPSYNFPDHRPATGKHVFIFSPKQHAWAAYNSSGSLVRTGRASGGAGYCPDIGRSCRTPVGAFSVYHKRGASCVSSKYPVNKGGAAMPHCMFFRGGYAIHGSGHVPNYNASHGCIRVQPAAAAWLSDDFLSNGSSVIVRAY